jgi:RNA polymerase sigma-70 factor (ECF subfamily)
VLAVAEANEQAARYELSYEDLALVVALRDGDEAAFVELVRRYRPSMLQVARLYVRTQAVAEEVVQETWIGVLNGIGRFQGRSSFKTWLFRILTNTAQTRAARERRTVPFSSFAQAELAMGEASVDPDRFIPHGERWESYWAATPRPFDDGPEGRLMSAETVGVVRAAIDELPTAQRAVITMRDVVGFSSEEVCAQLDLSEGNQRVLLHRARAKVRRALESHLEEADADAL